MVGFFQLPACMMEVRSSPAETDVHADSPRLSRGLLSMDIENVPHLAIARTRVVDPSGTNHRAAPNPPALVAYEC